MNLVKMLRNAEHVCASHAELDRGLAPWQWLIFIIWHFWWEAPEANPFYLRQEFLVTSPSGTNPIVFRTNLPAVGALGDPEPTLYREDLPRTVIELLLADKRVQAIALVRDLNERTPWQEPIVFSKTVRPVTERETGKKRDGTLAHRSTGLETVVDLPDGKPRRTRKKSHIIVSGRRSNRGKQNA